MAFVPVNDLKQHDVLQLPSQRGFIGWLKHPNKTVHAVLREAVTAPGDPETVDQLIVFQIVEADANIPSGTQTTALNSANANRYGLNTNKKWVVVMDPVEVNVDPNRYGEERKGHLAEDDDQKLRQRIIDFGGPAAAGIGPQGYAQANWDKIVGRGFERPLTDASDRLPRTRRKKLSKELTVIDLPLEHAGRVTDLDPVLIEKLRQKGIETLFSAKTVAENPEKLAELFPPTADSLPDITLEDAIAAKYLDEDTRGLGLVTDPINTKTSKAIKTLNELVKLTENDGEGFSSYVGLVSKTAKTRMSLSIAAQQAWQKYQADATLPASMVDQLSTKIKHAWDQAMEEYRKPGANTSIFTRTTLKNEP